MPPYSLTPELMNLKLKKVIFLHIYDQSISIDLFKLLYKINKLIRIKCRPSTEISLYEPL